MQNRHIGEGLRTAGDDDVVMPEDDLVRGIGNRLIGRGARAAHRVGVGATGQHRHEGDLTRDVRLDHRRDDRPVYDRLDGLAVEVGALQELRYRKLAELDRREVLEHRARFRERCPYAGHDRDAAAVRSERCHVGKLGTAESRDQRRDWF